MKIKQQILLSKYTTMRLGGPAKFMIDVHTVAQLQQAVEIAKNTKLAIFILGGGSNVIAPDSGFNGLVIRIKIPGFDVIFEDKNTTTIKVGAGENWDEFVKKTVAMQLTGVEALSKIPGTVGATLVQNVGAYGQEVANTIVSIDAFDRQKNSMVKLTADQCEFGYRDSIFRSTKKNRYIICAVIFQLKKTSPEPPFYDSIQKYFDENKISNYTPSVIREAVAKIRAEKLPDPTKLANCGSFFKNAIIDNLKLKELTKSFPEMPNFYVGNQKFKIPTGWLIEKVGLKGQLIAGMRVHDKNALVLINESAKNYQDLETARQIIKKKVFDKFGIIIEQEPIEIDT